jgi:ABC-type uncharacterized transport system substrate-binding protein
MCYSSCHAPQGWGSPWASDNPQTVLETGDAQAEARKLGLDVTTSKIRRADDIAPAIGALKGHAEALYVVSDGLTVTNRVRINTFALAARLPTVHANREYIETGGLISYGANYPDLFRRAGDYVDKILRGAKPSDLPVEQPTKFDLVINLTTAKALGWKSPKGSCCAPTRWSNEATRVHHAPRRRGGGVAVRGARAAIRERRTGSAFSAWRRTTRSTDAELMPCERAFASSDTRRARTSSSTIDGRYDRLPELAAELVKLNVDVLVTHSTPGSRAAQQATSTIPIVMAAVGDPVEAGLVASIARPGGNLTGLTFFYAELCAKRVELIKEAIPTLTRVAVLVNPANPAHSTALAPIRRMRAR